MVSGLFLFRGAADFPCRDFNGTPLGIYSGFSVIASVMAVADIQGVRIDFVEWPGKPGVYRQVDFSSLLVDLIFLVFQQFGKRFVKKAGIYLTDFF